MSEGFQGTLNRAPRHREALPPQPAVRLIVAEFSTRVAHKFSLQLPAKRGRAAPNLIVSSLVLCDRFFISSYEETIMNNFVTIR